MKIRQKEKGPNNHEKSLCQKDTVSLLQNYDFVKLRC